jgi:hypothetical protein
MAEFQRNSDLKLKLEASVSKKLRYPTLVGCSHQVEKVTSTAILVFLLPFPLGKGLLQSKKEKVTSAAFTAVLTAIYFLSNKKVNVGLNKKSNNFVKK